jgi:hypothetical protein
MKLAATIFWDLLTAALMFAVILAAIVAWHMVGL